MKKGLLERLERTDTIHGQTELDKKIGNWLDSMFAEIEEEEGWYYAEDGEEE